MNNNVLAQVAALPNMKTAELKKLWKDVFRADPPPFNKQYYVKRLAYRIQEVAYGVDSSRVDKRLSALCERDLDKPDKTRKRLEVHRPVTGTRLMREWQGHEHHVTVLEDVRQNLRGYDGHRSRPYPPHRRFVQRPFIVGKSD